MAVEMIGRPRLCEPLLATGCYGDMPVITLSDRISAYYGIDGAVTVIPP